MKQIVRIRAQLKAALPDIREKMLIQKLKVLVDNRLVHLIDFGTIPPKVEYS